MPRAKTGYVVSINTLLSRENAQYIHESSRKLGVSKARFINTLIQEASERALPRVEKIAYKQHERVKLVSFGNYITK